MHPDGLFPSESFYVHILTVFLRTKFHLILHLRLFSWLLRRRCLFTNNLHACLHVAKRFDTVKRFVILRGRCARDFNANDLCFNENHITVSNVKYSIARSARSKCAPIIPYLGNVS